MHLIDFHTHNKFCKNGIINLTINDELKSYKMCSIGIHPNSIDKDNYEKDLEMLKTKSESNNIIAIGECGLDKNSNTNITLQKYIFAEHIKLSEILKKPLIIHCVGYFNELIALKNSNKVKQAWIIHGFNKNQIIHKQLLNAGFHFSFGSTIFSKNFYEAEKIIRATPLTNLFLETDDTKKEITEIYELASDILGCSKEKLIFNIYNNFLNLFKNNNFA